MYAPDYQKELALSSEKRVPAIIAFLLIATFGAALWLCYVSVKSHFTPEEQMISGE